ncbi:OmpP1/FadL family transporter [Hymenobacter convexus]|uniref:OmpP1/FadL family transporter n=1 Tax=Hymenobacter sp. CA1UV-4 TaxID=3063782 RepID=UPI0027133176|nr:outer membrane protein transport protein [Hymenobacter sp. CA1UV-4]MDO7850920.1 outer membrane protein transport protein [Hymenobacter sp. CA1UV-4]
MTVKTLLLAGGTLLVSASAASASGFQVNLGGQKNIGMGGVGVALTLDQAAMFYNPGALAMVRDNGVQVGVNAALARNAFIPESGGGQSTLDNKLVTPFNFYAGFGPKEGKWKIGIGAYTPFGSELHYNKNWEGRYSLTDINLRSIFAQVTASYAITPQLSIGAGLVMLAYGDVDLQKDVPLTAQTGAPTPHVTLNGKAKQSFGYNAGIYFKPSDKVSVGVSYRSQVDAKIENGDVRLRDVIYSTGGNFTATNFSATLPLPATASVGVAIMPNDKLTISADANLVFWSAYRTLDFTFSGNNGYGDRAATATTPAVVGTPGLLGGSTTSSAKRYYQDALAFRLGGQYKVTEGLTVRAGGFYDMAAVKDGYISPETPDADRIGLTAGASYEFGKRFGIDASFLFEDFLKRSQSQSDLLNNGTTDRVAGTYKTTIAVPGVGLYVKF